MLEHGSSSHERRYVGELFFTSMFIAFSVAFLLGNSALSFADDVASRSVEVFVPLPPDTLKELNDAAQVAVDNSPVRKKAVTNIHHANLTADLFTSIGPQAVPIGTALKFQVSRTGLPLNVVIDKVERRSSDTLRIMGHVPGDSNSNVRLYLNAQERTIFGDIRIRGRLFEIRPASGLAHTIYTIDPLLLPPDHLPGKYKPRVSSARDSQPTALTPTAEPDTTMTVPPRTETVEHGAGSSSVPESVMGGPVDGVAIFDPTIDIMILYTEAARNQNGMGTISQQTCEAMDQLKDSIANSGGVQANFRLVHLQQMSREVLDERNYTAQRKDTNLENILSDIKSRSDLDALRTEKGADLVSLWVGDIFGSGTECGMSTTIEAPGNGYDGYSLMLRTCATAQLTFVHELGHLMGANHDRYKDYAAGSEKYNWGYVKADKGWRTIMAYNRSDCLLNSDNESYCDRLEHWSNPSVRHNDDATGEDIGSDRVDCNPASGDSPSLCRGPAYDRRTLMEAAPSVAKFRAKRVEQQINCGD